MSETLRTCERCGSEIPPEASVCPNCGAPAGGVADAVEGVPVATVRLDGPIPEPEESAVETAIPAEESVSQPETPPPAPAAQYTPPATPMVAPPSAPQEKKGGPLVWILSCCIVLVFLCCCLGLAISAAIVILSGG